MKRAILLFPALLLELAPVAATAQHALGGRGPYDAAVPSPAAVLGYELGARFTPHHVIARYLERVAQASPRVQLDTLTRTFEGREVLLATVSSEANQRRLAEIRTDLARLADPRGASAAELAEVVRRTPVVVWLGYNIHGGEASGAEAALGMLYQLAAGQDAETRAILDSAVVLIQPLQNPDGHERHVQDVLRSTPLCPGCFAGEDVPTGGAALVHQGNWPGARGSHYGFDMNRDWFILSHPETRAHVQVFLDWHPQVAVDLHEMGSGSTYFFAPPMEPMNQNVHPSIQKWWDIFAASNAAAFDRHGWSFFRREGYDEFYPGYGVSWPILTGAAGMTYEQASSGGGAVRRSDGTLMTLREAAAHHFAASFATALTAAQRRTERLQDFVAFRRSAVTDAQQGLRTILIERDSQGRADSLVARLLANGIEVLRLQQPPTVSSALRWGLGGNAPAFGPGSYAIDLAQPQGRLAKALLEPDAVLDSAFIREELESRRTGRENRFYDVTAWSLPFLFRVNATWLRTTAGRAEPVTAIPPQTYPAPVQSAYGYAFEPGSEAAIRMLTGLLADSVRVWHAPRSFRAGGRDFPHGALIVRVAANEPSVHELVRRQAAASGVRVMALSSALAESGTDLGSNSVRFVPAPRVALVGGSGVSGQPFGFAWYALDQRLHYPATPIPLSALGSAALNDFDVVILPSASGIDDALGTSGKQRLATWVRDGGVLITLEGASAWLAGEGSGLSRFRVRRDTVRADSAGGAPLPARVPGAILRVHADTLSPLLAGVNQAELPVLMNGATIYTAPKDLRAGEVVLRYAPVDQLRLSGYLWPEVPARVAGSPYLFTERIGSGRVIAFTADPNFRDMWRGLLPVFANAVLLGGSY